MISHADVPVRVSVDARPARSSQTLDDLAIHDAATLEEAFRDAKPTSLQAINGHPRGRVLAIPGRDRGGVAAVLRALHASSLWPWEGKSFEAAPGSVEGTGINRVRLPLHMGVFPFRTYLTPSVVDGGPCLAIDYDIARNPNYARPIYDEVRALDDGLFLGRGMRRGRRGPKLVLWFALDARIQDKSVRVRP
jgi:hypothetical protein